LTGSPIFVGRWVVAEQRDDVTIFGRGVAQRYDPNRDIALHALTYLPYEGIEFLNGVISNGVSLRFLISRVGERWFESRRGVPEQLKVYRGRKHIRLSSHALTWLSDEMEKRFQVHGTLPRA
jgi:hypothetical protein